MKDGDEKQFILLAECDEDMELNFLNTKQIRRVDE
jgi:hypothetical protein